MKSPLAWMYRGLGCLLLAGWPALAPADEGWGGSVGASSDYVYRGLSLSNNQPSVQVDGHYQGNSDWYAGLGAASAQRGADNYTAAALNAYAGQGWAWGGDWSGHLSLSHYDYAGADNASLYRYDELGAGLNWRHNVFLTLAASPDTSTQTYASTVWWYQQQPYLYSYVSGSHRGPAYVAELVLNEPLPWWQLSVNAGAGYRDLQQLEGLSYRYGSAGLAWSHGPWELDASYIGSSGAATRVCCGSPPANRFVASTLWRF